MLVYSSQSNIKISLSHCNVIEYYQNEVKEALGEAKILNV